MLNFISTPIGNLNDISLRAIDVIRNSDYLYSEDTRKVQKLLQFIKIKVKPYSFYEHNELKVNKTIIKRLKQNKTISIVSDAGTPVISDPGYKLIQECLKNNIKYTLIPGPSSVISALIMSGLPTDKFSFYGFVPRKKLEQEKFFENIVNDEKTMVFFESSKRIEKTISNLIEFTGENRLISICKEMTKIHEKTFRGKISEINLLIQKKQINIKGEIVVVLQGLKNKHIQSFIDKEIKDKFLSKLSASESAKLISLITGENKRDVYKKLIQT